jgi:DNA-binding MarR family transcriptional regulator
MSYAKGMPTGVVKIARTDAGLAAGLRISIMRLSRRLRQERGGPDDLTPNQLGVLGTLTRHGPLALGELAAHERVQPPSMTRTVTSLVEIGLVQREPNPADGRQVLVGLTDRGRDVVRESRRRKEAWINHVLADLTPDERRILREAAPILERIAQA